MNTQQRGTVEKVWIDIRARGVSSQGANDAISLSRLHPEWSAPEYSPLLPRYTSSPRSSPYAPTRKNPTGISKHSTFVAPPSPVLYNSDREELIQVTSL